MKKENKKVKKLQLSQETLRQLDFVQDGELKVAGATPMTLSPCHSVCTVSPVTQC